MLLLGVELELQLVHPLLELLDFRNGGAFAPALLRKSRIEFLQPDFASRSDAKLFAVVYAFFFMLVGHSLSLTFAPGRTQKSFE